MRSFLPLLFLVALPASAQRPAFAPEPQWVQPLDAVGSSITDRSTIQEGTEYQLFDQQYHLGRREYYNHSRLVLLDLTGVQGNSRISIDFDPTYQQVTIHRLRIIRGDRTIEKYDPVKVQVIQREEGMDAFLYDGTRTVVVELDDVRPGDILEQAWTVRGWSPSFGDRFQERTAWRYSVPIGKQGLRFVVPRGRPTRFISKLGAPDLLRTATRAEQVYSLVATDLPALQVEDDVPGEHERFPAIEVTEFADQEEVRAWAVGLFRTGNGVPPALRERVARWKSMPDVDARMDSAWYLVRDGIRYLGLEQGLSAYKPHAPDKVFEQRFGDCKDMSLLLAVLLNELGVEAWPALVNTYAGATLDQAVPRANAFDHCIVHLTVDGKGYWLDPTDSYARGTVRDHHVSDYGWALVLDPHRKGLDRMPAESPGSVKTVQKFELGSIDGAATLAVSSTYEGRSADIMRGRIAMKGTGELGNDYVQYYTGLYGEVVPTDPLSFEDDPVGNRLVVHEAYDLLHPWKPQDGDSTSANIKFNIDPGTLKDYLQVPGHGVRKEPLALRAPVHVVDRFEITLPEVWPDAEEEASEHGHGVDFRFTTRTRAKFAEVEYDYSTTARRVEPEDYADFEAQQARIQDWLGRDFLWNGSTTVETTTRDVRPHELMHWLLFLAIGAWVCRKIWKWDPDPVSRAYPGEAIGGWLVLPAIGLCLSPFIAIWALVQDDFGMVFLTDSLPSLAVDRPFLAHLFVYVSQLLVAFDLVWFPVLAVLFFRRRTSVRKLMVFTYVLNLASLLFDALMYHVHSMDEWAGAYGYSEISRAVFAAAIWIPYFLVSERVKNTFVKRLKPMALPPPITQVVYAPSAPPAIVAPFTPGIDG